MRNATTASRSSASLDVPQAGGGVGGVGLTKEYFKMEETQACLLMGESRLRGVVKDTESEKDLLSKVPER